VAAAATLTTVVDGTRRRIIDVLITSDDGSELSDTVIYDFSADTNAPTNHAAGDVSVEWVEIDVPGAGEVKVEFDGATDVLIAMLDGGVQPSLCKKWSPSLENGAATPTGDITITTTNLSSGDDARVRISVRKGGTE